MFENEALARQPVSRSIASAVMTIIPEASRTNGASSLRTGWVPPGG